MGNASNETMELPSDQTASGATDLLLSGESFGATAASQYLATVRASVENQEFDFDRNLLRSAILAQCIEQIDRDGSVAANSFAWLREHETTHLDTLFPGLRHGSHDPRVFPASIGQFVLLGMIGHGGFATVYRAIDITYRRQVALKALNAVATVGERPRRKMLEEAKLLQETNCAHVVRVYGVYEIGRETLISMRLIDGGNLSEILQEGPLARDEAAEMVRQVATGIAAAHERNIVHRDLKPGNVLRDLNDCWYVADFGLAKRLDRSVSHSSPNHSIGTWSYSSPEQLKHQDVNTKSDIFALGLLLFEAVTGVRAFDADGPGGRLRMIEHQDEIGTRKYRRLLGGQLFAIVIKCLQFYPEHRYETVTQLQTDLANYLAGKQVSVQPPSLMMDLRQFVRQRKKFVFTMATILLVVLTSFIMLMVASTRHRMGVELQRQGLVVSAIGDLVDANVDARQQAFSKLRRAAALRTDNDLINPFIATHLKPSTIGHWEIAGKPFQGFDVTPDGRRAAVATDGGGIRIVSRDSNDSFELQSSVSQPALFLEWADGGRYLVAMHRLPSGATNEDRRPFFVWDIHRRRTLDTIPIGIHDEGWAFTDGGRAIVAANAKSAQIEAIDLESGRLLHHFSIPDRRWVRGLAMDPSGDWIAIAYADRVVETRELSSGKRIDRWQLPHDILDIDVGPAGLVAVAAGNDAYLFESGQSQATSIIHAHSAQVDRIRFSQRGDQFLTRSNRRELKVWNSLNGELRLTGSANRAVRFVSGDRQIAGLSALQGFRISVLSQYDLQTTLVSPALRGEIRNLCFSHDASQIYLAGDDGIVAWDLRHPSNSPTIVDPLPTGNVQEVMGNLLSSHRFAIRSRQQVELLGDAKGVWSHATRDHHYGSSLAADPNGKRIAVVQQSSNSIAVIDSNPNGNTINLDSGNVGDITISNDANWVASASWDLGRSTYLWNLNDSGHRHELPGGSSTVLFLPDCRRLVTGSAAEYTVWNIHTREAIHRIQRRLGNTDAPLAVSRDGSMLALGTDHEHVSIVDPASCQSMFELPVRQSNQVKSLFFSRTGRELAALLEDGVVLVWRLDRLRSRIEAEGLSWPIETRAGLPADVSTSISDLPIVERFRRVPAFDWLPNASAVGTIAAPIHRRIESLRDRLKDVPGDTEALDELARECFVCGGVEESLRIYLVAQEIETKDERWYFIGLLRHALGMKKEHDEIIELIADQPLDADGQGLWLTRLVLLQPRANPALSAKALDAVNKQLAVTNNRWLRMIHSLALIRAGEPEQAGEILRHSCDGKWGELDSLEQAIAALALRQSGNDSDADAVVRLFRKNPNHRFPDLRLYAEQLIAEAEQNL